MSNQATIAMRARAIKAAAAPMPPLAPEDKPDFLCFDFFADDVPKSAAVVSAAPADVPERE
jgi:hypothetical protein